MSKNKECRITVLLSRAMRDKLDTLGEIYHGSSLSHTVRILIEEKYKEIGISLVAVPKVLKDGETQDIPT